MRTSFRLIALTLSLLLPRVSHAGDADATQVARAENYAAAAYDAYSRKDYVAAVALYRKALEAAPSADITYNLARIYDTKLKNRVRAIEFYGRYVADPGGEPERVQSAMERLSVLREQQRIASGATLPPTAAGEAPRGAAATPRALPPDSGLTIPQVTGIVVGAFGVAGIAAGVGFGLAAKSNADVAHDFCTGDLCQTQRGVDAAERGSAQALVSTTAFIAGGALLVGGVTLLVLGGRAHEQAAHTSAWIGPNGFGLRLASRF